MSDLGLPPAAEQVLARLLEHYRDDRERWPLWTYERRDPLGRELIDSWFGQPWVERLRFSSLFPLNDIRLALDRVVRNAGARLLTFSPSSPRASIVTESAGGLKGEELEALALEGGRSDGQGYVEWKPAAVQIPIRLRVRTAAVIGAMMHPSPPTDPTGIGLPDRWSWARLPLDDKDQADLANSALFALSRFPTAERSTPQSSASLFLRMMETEARSSRGHSRPGKYQERWRDIAVEFVRNMGLAGLRPGGRKRVMTETSHRQLLHEAVDILEEAREWEPSEPLAGWARAAVDEDESLLERISDHREYGRARQALSASSVEKRALWLARALRFPFITTGELQRALETGSIKRGGVLLVRSRLAARVTTKTLDGWLDNGA